jgi:A/G-specific adenine glycosylase
LIDNHSGAELLLVNQNDFVEQLQNWWAEDHTHLPWRQNKDPYGIWIAEVMLQQTQITTVIPYYEEWMSRFPTVGDLAQASLDEVLKLWQGLGYYSRARNLHAASKIVLNQYSGQLPEEVSELMKLPGIGRYTAGAIASIAFGRPEPVLDGNVIRVISRLVDLQEDTTRSSTRNELWRLSSALVPHEKPGDFNQSIMELGQRICHPAKPNCSECPVSNFCIAYERGTQYERPVRPPSKRIPHYNVVAGIIWWEQPSPDGKFLITRRPFDSMLGGLWEFPGGKVEDSEENAEALRREIAEELSIDIQVGQHLCEVKHAYTHFRITLHAYHAKYLSGTPQHIGVIDHAWVTLTNLERYAFAVTDLRIITALKNEFA